MPKRSHEDEDSDYLLKKLRKIEKKLKKRRERSRKRIIGSSSSSDIEIVHKGNGEIEADVLSLPIVADQIEAGSSNYLSPDVDASVLGPDQIEESLTTLPELDEEILNILGDTPSKEKKIGPNIQNDLAARFEYIAISGLSNASRKELIEQYLIPRNCSKIDAPKLNPEIKAALSDRRIKKDKALEQKQRQLATAITCIGNALTHIFSSENRDQTVMKLLVDDSRILRDSQYKESLTRRSIINSTIKKELKDQVFNTEIDNFLYGEKLADAIKAAKAINKSGAELKQNTATRKSSFQTTKQISNYTLNQKPPLPLTARRAGAARRLETAPATPPVSRPGPPQQPRQLRSQQYQAQRR